MYVSSSVWTLQNGEKSAVKVHVMCICFFICMYMHTHACVHAITFWYIEWTTSRMQRNNSGRSLSSYSWNAQKHWMGATENLSVYLCVYMWKYSCEINGTQIAPKIQYTYVHASINAYLCNAPPMVWPHSGHLDRSMAPPQSPIEYRCPFGHWYLYASVY